MGRISPAKKRTAAARAAKNDEPHTPDESESESSLAAAPRTPARCKKQLRETEAKLENLRARAHAKQQAVSRTRTQLKGLKTELQETRSNGLDHLASANTASADLDGLGLRHQLVLDSLEDEKAAHSATRVRLELAWAALEAKERAYATLEHTLASERERLDEVKARRNVLKQEVDKYRARERRKAAKAQKPLEQPTFRLKKRNKKKSPLQDDVRDAIAELTGLGVASTPMYRVFLVVARLLGVRLVGEFSSSTVLRCVEEAGFAGRVQLGDAATHATCMCSSLDVAHCSQK
jgi:chromosome segregation ATPase